MCHDVRENQKLLNRIFLQEKSPYKHWGDGRPKLVESIKASALASGEKDGRMGDESESRQESSPNGTLSI